MGFIVLSTDCRLSQVTGDTLPAMASATVWLMLGSSSVG